VFIHCNVCACHTVNKGNLLTYLSNNIAAPLLYTSVLDVWYVLVTGAKHTTSKTPNLNNMVLNSQTVNQYAPPNKFCDTDFRNHDRQNAVVSSGCGNH